MGGLEIVYQFFMILSIDTFSFFWERKFFLIFIVDSKCIIAGSISCPLTNYWIFDQLQRRCGQKA